MLVVAGAAAAAALLTAGAVLFLQSSWGGEVVRRTALPRLNSRLAGRVDVGGLAFRGGSVRLTDLELRDPRGGLVARVGAVEIDVSPTALLHRRLSISRLLVERPWLGLVRDARGWNLSRALAARGLPGRSAPPGAGGQPGWRVDVEHLQVQDGTVDYRTTQGGPTPPHARAAGLGASGEAHVDLATGAMNARVHAEGRVAAPVDAPLALDAQARRAGGALDAAVDLDLGGARVTARAALAPGGGFRLDVDRLRVPPEIAGAVLPALGLRAPLEGTLSLRGGARDLSSVSGHVDLSLGSGTLGGAPVGPARLEASARGGVLRVDALSAALPGLTVEAGGTASRARLDLVVTARARDLARTAHALAPAAREAVNALGPVEGHGTLRLRLGGSWAAPKLDLEGRFPVLELGRARVRELGVVSAWPDVRRPWLADATVRAARASAGDRTFDGVRARLSTGGRTFDLRLRTGGRDALAVQARGRWRGERRLELTALSVTSAEAAWRQAGRPIELAFGPGRLRARGLDLRAGPQRVRADVELRGARLRAALDLQRFRPESLPRLLVPHEYLVRGRIDLAARLDVPARWPPPRAALPASAHVALRADDAASLLSLLGAAPFGAGGPLVLDLDLQGTTRAPRLAARARVGRVSVDGQAAGDLELTLDGGDDGPTSVALTLGARPAGGPSGWARASTPLSVADLMARAAGRGAWARVPWTMEAGASGVPLRPLARAAGREATAGTLDVRLSAAGTAAAPAGALNVVLRNASARGLPATDARLDVALGPRDCRVAARVWRAGDRAAHVAEGPLLGWLSGVVDLPANRLRAAGALESAPLRVELGVGPVEVRRRDGASPVEPAALRARLRVAASISGTARAPEIALTADAGPVALDGSPLGTARAVARYQAGRARVDATFASAGGGVLHLDAKAAVDLGYPEIARGIDLERLPIDAALQADRFDLRWLSGATPAVRAVAGTLTASLRARGPAAAPVFGGRVEVTDGAATIAGLGAYQDVHLLAHGDQQGVRLDELTAESLGGRARLSGQAELAGDGARLELTARLHRFPIYAEGQILARLSIEGSVRGTVAPGGLEVHAPIEQARVELQTLSRRNLSSLTRPADVVLLDHGQPVDAEAARKLRALRAGAAGRTGGRGGPQAGFTATVILDAPRNLWVRGDDANVELGLEPNFRVVLGARPRVYGRVLVRRGRVDVLGRRFDLQEGSTVSFTGPPDRPVLDVTAKQVSESVNVTVIVKVEGPMDKLSISVSAPDRPDLTETQLYTLILSGRLDFAAGAAGGPSATSAAASLVGGALAGQLRKLVGARLPLDVFSFETSDGFTGARLEAGKNVGGRLYLGYVGRAGANPALLQNRNAVHLEYQLTARWSVDAEYGDVGTGTADLFWTKRY